MGYTSQTRSAAVSALWDDPTYREHQMEVSRERRRKIRSGEIQLPIEHLRETSKKSWETTRRDPIALEKRLAGVRRAGAARKAKAEAKLAAMSPVYCSCGCGALLKRSEERRVAQE